MNYGFVKVAAAVPRVQVADCSYNQEQIEVEIVAAAAQKVELLVFPELCITGYTCGDLFAQPLLLSEAIAALGGIVATSARAKNLYIIVGMPLEVEGKLLNCGVVLREGVILGIVPKSYLPNYREFYEQRWFVSGADVSATISLLSQRDIPVESNILFDSGRFRFAIELCEDVWAPIPPSSRLALQGADILVNLSASNEGIAKHAYLCQLLSGQSSRCLAGYVYASSGFGESTTDVVYAGNGLIYENGTLLAASERFSLEPQLVVSEVDVENLRMLRRLNTTFSESGKREVFEAARVVICEGDTAVATDEEICLTRHIDPTPFVPAGKALDDRCEEIFSIQVHGLAKRLVHTHCKNVVVGISGGLDSTLALLVSVRTFDKLGLSRKGIIGITMPGFGTTDRTYNNAIQLMRSLGITIREIPIREACLLHFRDIQHDPSSHDVTYENVQARERTQILMDVANQQNGLVIGTGDLSELALGWATYNGDHISMYAVNTSIPKTLVRHLVTWVAQQPSMDNASRDTLMDIVDTPISPELIPADEAGNIKQKTEDLVGPYELHDFFLCHFFRFGARPSKIYFLARQAFRGKYDDATILRWMTTFFRRFFAQQFKRSCIPDGPKVGSVVLSPRGDWRMPSDASPALWLKECEQLRARLTD